MMIHPKGARLGIIATAFGVCLVIGIGIFLSFTTSVDDRAVPPLPPGTELDPEVLPYQATLTGTYVCLPHKDTSGPQTLECAFGLKTDAGVYYALDLQKLGGGDMGIPMGSRVRAQGMITPVELLSSDHWRIYPVSGIMSADVFVKA